MKMTNFGCFLSNVVKLCCLLFLADTPRKEKRSKGDTLGFKHDLKSEICCCNPKFRITEV